MTVTNAQVLDALHRWVRDNPPTGAAASTLLARAELYRRLRELNATIALQERAVLGLHAGPKPAPGGTGRAG